MSFEPNPSQVLYLWSLLTAGGEGFVKDQPFQPSAPDRKALVKSGWIEEEKRPDPVTRRNANYNIVSDAGWAWMGEHLTAPLPIRSTRGIQIMQALIARLDTFLTARQLSLAELLSPGLLADSASSAPEPSAPELEERIRNACYELGQQRWEVRVRLADLRNRLLDVDRPTLDRELFRLQRERRLVLYPLDDPREITRADEEAAIDIGGVGKRHIVYAKE